MQMSLYVESSPDNRFLMHVSLLLDQITAALSSRRGNSILYIDDSVCMCVCLSNSIKSGTCVVICV